MADLRTLRITRRISPYSEIVTLIHRISTDYRKTLHQILYLDILNFIYLSKWHLFSEFLDYSIQTSNFTHSFSYISFSIIYLFLEFLVYMTQLSVKYFQILLCEPHDNFSFYPFFSLQTEIYLNSSFNKAFTTLLPSTILIKSYSHFRLKHFQKLK